jgi:release factor glutamine methyltransferase
MSIDSQELYRILLRSLTLPVDEGEKRAILTALLEDRLGLSPTDLLSGRAVSAIASDFQAEIDRINAEEPLQHILGYAIFLRRKFSVDRSVLIPRPETELLVQHIRQQLVGRTGDIFDVGTGSGCIAITLALELPQLRVQATEVSHAALKKARQNAETLQAKVLFHHHDILKAPLPTGQLLAVVSNPPYIMTSQRSTLANNVVRFEPPSALFVPDDDPLVFHREIARKSRAVLQINGLLAMEINEQLGLQTAGLLESEGYDSIEIHRDLDGKDRFVSAIKL